MSRTIPWSVGQKVVWVYPHRGEVSNRIGTVSRVTRLKVYVDWDKLGEGGYRKGHGDEQLFLWLPEEECSINKMGWYL